MKKIFKKSKWIHKYIGLVVLVFLIWMSITGIILNHPDIIEKYSVNKAFVPKSYHPKNWNRSTMKGIVIDKNNSAVLYLYGRQGVFFSDNRGKSFVSFMEGSFPKSPKGRRTNSLYALNNVIVAATNNGIYVLNKNTGRWTKSFIPSDEKEFVKILRVNDKLLALTKSQVFESDLSEELNFKEIKLNRDVSVDSIRLIDFFFSLHDGSIFGIFGKLLWDFAGIVILFLSISAFYIWYYPKKRKRKFKINNSYNSDSEKSVFKLLYKYHKKLGWYLGLLVLIITLTGIFLRPPLIAVLARKAISSKFLPSSSNVWNHKIHNALYDSANEKLVIECKDGIWSGSTEGDRVFSRINIPVNIFAMGATVFDELKKGEWIIGSFGGIATYNVIDKEVNHILPQKPDFNSVRPASTMITSYVQMSDSVIYLVGHYKGLCDINGVSLNVIKMPPYIEDNYRMPLWNYMFEIHNARMFRSFIGGLYILIIPLFGILSVLVLLSGFFDYMYAKYRKKTLRNKSLSKD